MKVVLLAAALLVIGFNPASAQEPMKFFVTSTAGPDASGPRGVAAADQYCATLAYTAGYGDFEWRAFLDAPAAANRPAAVARERIGSGPWHNFHSIPMAQNVAGLLGEAHSINVETAVNEKGQPVYTAGSGPTPHEILKTAKPDANGRYFCFAR